MIQSILSKNRPLVLMILRHGMPLLVLAICGALLWDRLEQMDLGLVRQTIIAVPLTDWALAGLATWVSFHAIGHYDAVWHRIMGTRITSRAARLAGMQAIAIAQLLGFGAVTASLVRWRSIPALSLWSATRLSAAVTLTFSLCWAVFAVVALWWLGQAAFGLPFIALFALLGAVVVIAEMVRRRWMQQLAYRHVSQLMGWTAVDMVFAGIALFVLLPEGTDLPMSSVIAAYVIALGAGLLSNAPGGAGAFDLMLLSLLPLDAPEPLVAALVIFRITYYVIPALLALALLSRPSKSEETMTPSYPAGWGLARQTGSMRKIGGCDFYVKNLPFVMASLGPHLRDAQKSAQIAAFHRHAWRRMKISALYNCEPRMAKLAHESGWHVRRTAMEALINPATWSTDGPQCQNLRRKLRQAASAGTHVIEAGDELPLTRMTEIAENWAASHGGELGGTMGRFCPDYISSQRVFLILHDTQLVGFVSFHCGSDGWLLDLIRHSNSLPVGAIHVAITTAIGHAAKEGVTRLSLSTVPDPRHTPKFWWTRKAGLIQFKRSFNPCWAPRYHASPTQAGFWLSGLIIGLAIHRPIANLPFRVAQSHPIISFAIAVRRQS